MEATSGPHQRHLGRAVPHVHDFHPALVDVANDGVPPKSVVATVAYDVAMAGTYVDDVLAMTWPATSTHFLAV